MANNLTITEGAGTTVATDQVGTAHYQKIKIVDGTADSSNPMLVDVTGKTYVHSLTQGTVSISGATGTLGVYLSATAGSIRIGDIPGSVAVYFSPANPAVNTTLTGSMAVYFSSSNPAVNIGTPTIQGITNSINVYLGATAGTLVIKLAPETGLSAGVNNIGDVDVLTLPSIPAGVNNIGDVDVLSLPMIPAGTNLIGNVKISDGTDIALVTAGGLLQVDASGVAVPITDNAGSLTVDGTVTANVGTGTMAVYFSGSEPTVRIKDTYHTSIISGNVSSSYAGVSDLGITLVAAEAGHAIKVYALQLTTTAQVQTVVQFTNGAGAATEYWRYALQAPTAGIAGANLAITPPGYLFATAVGSTLALVTKNASLVHYSIAYFKESA